MKVENRPQRVMEGIEIKEEARNGLIGFTGKDGDRKAS
jgi:hypothetical protein